VDLGPEFFQITPTDGPQFFPGNRRRCLHRSHLPIESASGLSFLARWFDILFGCFRGALGRLSLSRLGLGRLGLGRLSVGNWIARHVRAVVRLELSRFAGRDDQLLGIGQKVQGDPAGDHQQRQPGGGQTLSCCFAFRGLAEDLIRCFARAEFPRDQGCCLHERVLSREGVINHNWYEGIGCPAGDGHAAGRRKEFPGAGRRWSWNRKWRGCDILRGFFR